MLDLRPEDILHKSHLHRLLMEILDEPRLAQALAFKGGTCAAMLGHLDRFSVDLDFDLLDDVDRSGVRAAFHEVFVRVGYEIEVELDEQLFFQLRYPSRSGEWNTLEVSVDIICWKANQYRVRYIPEIDRLANSQTIETMFANKLVAATDRYEQHGSIAGRDLYDIHHFFVQGYRYHEPVIEERTGLKTGDYLEVLIEFIRKHVTQRQIDEDLNTLLPPKQFQQVRKILLPELVAVLEAERGRV
jgi:predicted nucleotidyltransferase component of viral defense system